MAIFAAAATKAIKSIDEITPGMELWEGSWQHRDGYVYHTPMIVIGAPVKLGESIYNCNDYKPDDSMYHEYIIPTFNNHTFCTDSNIGWGDKTSYNDNFLFRTKEDAEEFVKAGAALLETNPEVLKAFTFRELEDAIMFETLIDDAGFDDLMDEYDNFWGSQSYPEDVDDYEINGED